MHSDQAKKILIAVPTARLIEVETFKSIYDQNLPPGYISEFRYFTGYDIDLVRNEIAEAAIDGYDYLFSVDSDLIFPSYTLSRMLAHNKPIVSGLYIQRIHGSHTLEVYESTPTGGVSHIPYGKIKGKGLVEIKACGFGCALIKTEVIKAVGHPYFVYHSALDHKNTVSEDVDFCRKATAKGFSMWADTTIQCQHIGSYQFVIDNDIAAIPEAESAKKPPAPTPLKPAPLNDEEIKKQLIALRERGRWEEGCPEHFQYLGKLKESGFEPKVIYDIGACVLHWTDRAKKLWPDAEYVAFEASPKLEFFYKEENMRYHIGVLSDKTGREVDFFENDRFPAGNSYYRENPRYQPIAAEIYSDDHKRRVKAVTLDAVVNLKQFPKPDFIKMDIQGSELDVLKGAEETIKDVEHIVLELQRVEYNLGAPLNKDVIDYMDSLGYDCLGEFSPGGPDGDFHFKKR